MMNRMLAAILVCSAMLGASCQDSDNPVLPNETDNPATTPTAAEESMPLTLEAKEAGAVVKLEKYQDPSLRNFYYKEDDGEWKEYTLGTGITLEKAGDKVQFWSNNQALHNGGSDYVHFTASAKCYVYGNVMSMIDDQEGATAERPKFSTDKVIGASHALRMLFRDNDNLLSHATIKLVLPATTLTQQCYSAMFYKCSSLTEAPALEATELKDNCYSSMFYGCTALAEAPELKAETLAEACYYGMFSCCTALTEAPELKAETLASYCYQSMFEGCSKLAEAPELPATKLASTCYYGMFSDCTALAEAPELKAETLAEACYSYMFKGCTALAEAPELPATKLTEECYYSMFSGCTALAEAPELPAEELAETCYHSMFEGCTALTKAPELKAAKLASRCYLSMFEGCSKLGSVKCLATDLSGENSLNDWLVDAGTEVASPKLYVDKSMTGAAWQNERFAVTAVEEDKTLLVR